MDNNHVRLDSVFHALADPTRRAVVQQLTRGPSSISDLAAPFPMALPSFMKHISVLERSGLVGSRKVGRVRTCRLVPRALDAAERWFDEQRRIYAARYDNLDALLGEIEGENDNG